jgi:chromosomal replication initiator protein
MRAWDDFLALQEVELGVETVHKWLKPLKVIRFDAGNLYLEAKDSFHALWFEEHLRQKILTKFVNNNNKKIKVHLNVASRTPKPKTAAKSAAAKPANTSQFVLSFDELDPYCTFNHFIVGENNLLAHKLMSRLTQELGAFIHGGIGSGKTHLLMAVTHELREKGLRVVYTRAETFTEHVVSAIRLGEMSIFRQAYRNTDVLIIDDVQIFSKKGATQEEFFHTFNTLHLDGKQIILSANCPPSELQHIEPRLVSRFEWGIVLNLFTLNRELQSQMLQQKAAFLHFPIHIKVIDYLLDQFSSSSRSLVRAMEALVLRAHLNGQSARLNTTGVTVLMAKQILQDLLIEEQKQLLTPEKAVQYVAEVFGIKAEDILGKVQTRECVFPRQLAMHICRHRLKMPFTKIGEIFSKDHSTVISSVKLIQNGLDNNDSEIVNYHHLVQKKLMFTQSITPITLKKNDQGFLHEQRL